MPVEDVSLLSVIVSLLFEAKSVFDFFVKILFCYQNNSYI